MSTPPSFLTDEMRSQAIGVESEPAVLEVEKGAIARFAEAIGDPNPSYTNEAAARRTPPVTLVAPPTFLRSMRAVRPQLPFDIPFERVLDGGSAWEYFQPVRAGRHHYRRCNRYRHPGTHRTAGIDAYRHHPHHLLQPV